MLNYLNKFLSSNNSICMLFENYAQASLKIYILHMITLKLER